MSHPIQVELISDDDEDDNINHALVTPRRKRPRTEFHTNSTPFLIVEDDDHPIPLKLPPSASSSRCSTSQTSSSGSSRIREPPTLRHKSKDVKNPSSGSSSLPRISGVGGLICLESDDEAEESPEWGSRWKDIGAFSGFDEDKDLDTSPTFAARDKQWQNGETSPDFRIGNCLKKSSIDTEKAVHTNAHDAIEEIIQKRVGLKNGTSFSDFSVETDSAKKSEIGSKSWRRHEAMIVDFDVECLKENPTIVKSTSYLETQKSTKTYDSVYPEDDTDQILPCHRRDHGKEHITLEEEGAICRFKSKGNANAQLKQKQNQDENIMNRKKSQEEKTHLMKEKKLKKQQEKLQKTALKAEAASSKQLEKDKQRWEKECEKNILTEIDPKVLQCGSIGGHLLTRFGEKGLRFNITSNPVEKSIVWRMNIPEELSQLSSLGTDIRYVLLIYGAEEFCKVTLDGSLLDHISSVRNQYPSYTICFLTNRLMSYINKREQDQYRNRNGASDWQRPPVEEVLAKLTTHFANVHSRQCVDEAELADHVVGLTINLAKCRFRKKLTPIFVNANGCNVPKNSVDRDLILKNTWLKMMVAIPKVQPRFAIAIWKKYPTMKSLLCVYMDPTKSVHEKETLLKDLMTEGPLCNEDRRLGEICSKRIYRILMAQNGSIANDEVEDGADYFTTNPVGIASFTQISID